MERPILVTTAVPDRDIAERIADALVDEGLAAAAHLREVASRYRWRGDVVAVVEHVLDIYTSAGRYDAVAARIAALHPYAMPGIHWTAIDGGPAAYLAWIASAGADPV